MADLILPYQPLPADATNILADRLEESLKKLGTLGISISPRSRLWQAVTVLRDVHRAKEYPREEAELVRVGNAIKVAFNLVRVADALKPPGPPGVLASLNRAVSGTLDDIGPSAAHRAQSELFFGVAFVAGGGRTGAPKPGNGKTPDYVVEIDGVAFSVEVKRPESLRAIEDKIGEAVRQIREYRHYPALIGLDLSDTLPIRVGVSDIQDGAVQNQSVFRDGYAAASAYITRRSTIGDEGYTRVALLFCFGESFLWDSSGPYPLPHSSVLVYAEVFQAASAGLIVGQARRLRLCVLRGFEEVGGAFRRLSRVP